MSPKPWRKSKRHICCIVWASNFDGGLTMGCIHCLRIFSRHQWSDTPEVLARLVVSSRQGHDRVCRIPVRPSMAS